MNTIFHIWRIWLVDFLNKKFICIVTGNTVPTNVCAAGYFCTLSASTSTPTDVTTGNICPAGRYCEAGSITGVGCPQGTFSNMTGLTNSSECTQCTPGYYCGTTGLTAESGQCSAG